MYGYQCECLPGHLTVLPFYKETVSDRKWTVLWNLVDYNCMIQVNCHLAGEATALSSIFTADKGMIEPYVHLLIEISKRENLFVINHPRHIQNWRLG